MRRGALGYAKSEPQEASATGAGEILAPGRNCWRVDRAERFRCVQDGAEYFRLVREAILRARRSVFIVGWDITAGVDLLPGVEGTDEPKRLAELLDFVAHRQRGLHCYVLIWGFSLVYALERDPFGKVRLGWRTHRRVHFRFDTRHPLGASHHQKFIVVDDRLAFSGGLDLTGHRWDTREHSPEHPLRTNAFGQPYPPFHDVQGMVEGPIASSLGELARERCRRRGWWKLPPIEPSAESLWPESVEPDLEDVDVAIARTEPRFRGRPAVRECEALFLDSIAAARRTIYVENQYFTNLRLGEALAARLREKDGPELIVLGPEQCSGWLEEKTMGALRREVLAKLQEADRHGRLRLLHAVASRKRCIQTFIHSKVMIVDDVFLRIGSANLSNRSMGMDTECDLVVEDGGDPRVRAGIRRVRDRLLAEHLGLGAEEVGRAIERAGSLRSAIDGLCGGDRALMPIEVDLDPESAPSSAVRMAADPNEPMHVTRAVDRLIPEIEEGERRRGLVALPFSALLLGTCLAWRSSEWRHWIDAAWWRELLGSAPWTPEMAAAALAGFVAGSLLFVPSELLVLAAVLVLGPVRGGLLVVAGACIAAALGYGAGRALGLARLVPWIGRRASRLGSELRGRGTASVAVLRALSLASDTTVSLLCGAARVPWRAYWTGTLIGIAPGILAMGVLGGLLRLVILRPHPGTVAVVVVLSFALIAVVLRMRRILRRRQIDPAVQEQEERARFG